MSLFSVLVEDLKSVMVKTLGIYQTQIIADSFFENIDIKCDDKMSEFSY